MSVAVRAPSHPIAGNNMVPKPAPRLQSRPSSSSSTLPKPMAPRPAAPRVEARPPATTAASSSRLTMKPTTAPSPTSRPAPPTRASSTSSATTPPSAPVPSSKDTSSSAGKIFAKPSKEWVLPERAKPGRKVSVEEPDNKRQSQNRLSQRAHRARRTDYITTLEERLRQYEADEIHSNVRLQEVARALKADNERLRNDVDILKKSYAEIYAERSAWEIEKRSMQDSMRRMQNEVDALRAGKGVSTIVRMEVDQEAIDRLVPGPSLPRRTSTSTSIPIIATQKRALVDCPICPNPDPDCPCQQADTQQAFTPLGDPTLAPADRETSTSACGFCRSTEECLCRAVEDDIKPDITSSPSKGFKPDEGCGLCTSSSFCACRAASDTPSTPSMKAFSGIFNSTTSTQATPSAPTVAAALPLRMRARSNTNKLKPSIWSLDTGTSSSTPAVRPKEAVCTGDPSNCDACRNDSFGREFCQHLFEATGDSSGTFKPCGECPGNCMSIKSLLSPSPDQAPIASSSSSRIRSAPLIMIDDEPPTLAPLQMACCGNPELCGGHQGTGCTGEVVALGGMRGESPEHDHDHGHDHAHAQNAEDDHTTLRPDQAWKTLKAHPNAKFASLALLADVVARRTVCLSQAGELDSAPQSSSPLLANSRSPLAPTSAATLSPTAISGGDGSARTGAASKRRTLGVETSGVRDALKLLDRATPTPSAASPVLLEEREVKKRKVDF